MVGHDFLHFPFGARARLAWTGPPMDAPPKHAALASGPQATSHKRGLHFLNRAGRCSIRGGVPLVGPVSETEPPGSHGITSPWQPWHRFTCHSRSWLLAPGFPSLAPDPSSFESGNPDPAQRDGAEATAGTR